MRRRYGYRWGFALILAAVAVLAAAAAGAEVLPAPDTGEVIYAEGFESGLCDGWSTAAACPLDDVAPECALPGLDGCCLMLLDPELCCVRPVWTCDPL